MKKGFYEAAVKASKDGREVWFFTLDGKLYEVCGGYTELKTDGDGITLGIIDITNKSDYDYVTCRGEGRFIPRFQKTFLTKNVEENQKFEYYGEEYDVVAYGCPVDGLEMPEEVLDYHIESFLENVLSHKYEGYDTEFVKEFSEVFKGLCNSNWYPIIDTIGEAYDSDYETLDTALEFFESEGVQKFINMFEKSKETAIF